MKFITIKNSKKRILYSVKTEGDTVIIYLFDDVKNGKVIRAIHAKRDWFLRKIINRK